MHGPFDKLRSFDKLRMHGPFDKLRANEWGMRAATRTPKTAAGRIAARPALVPGRRGGIVRP
jgi:hypothetical protein